MEKIANFLATYNNEPIDLELFVISSAENEVNLGVKTAGRLENLVTYKIDLIQSKVLVSSMSVLSLSSMEVCLLACGLGEPVVTIVKCLSKTKPPVLENFIKCLKKNGVKVLEDIGKCAVGCAIKGGLGGS